MRLPLLAPPDLSAAQRALYDDMRTVIDGEFGQFVAVRGDGALLGPFNAWLHSPDFGCAAWAFNRSLWDHAQLPATIHQLVALVTVSRFGAGYAIYGHEYFAHRAGLSKAKIATIAAGLRPADLTEEERVAYDMAAALQRGGFLAESTYQAVVDRFGVPGAAEMVFLVGCFSMVAVTLNAFDAAAPRVD